MLRVYFRFSFEIRRNAVLAFTTPFFKSSIVNVGCEFFFRQNCKFTNGLQRVDLGVVGFFLNKEMYFYGVFYCGQKIESLQERVEWFFII